MTEVSSWILVMHFFIKQPHGIDILWRSVPLMCIANVAIIDFLTTF